MAAGTENMWTLVVEVYSALRKIRLLHQITITITIITITIIIITTLVVEVYSA